MVISSHQSSLKRIVYAYVLMTPSCCRGCRNLECYAHFTGQTQPIILLYYTVFRPSPRFVTTDVRRLHTMRSVLSDVDIPSDVSLNEFLLAKIREYAANNKVVLVSSTALGEVALFFNVCYPVVALDSYVLAFAKTTFIMPPY